MINKETLEYLHKQGLSYSEIGKLLDISRQRVHQMITGYESPATKRTRTERKGKSKKSRIYHPKYPKYTRVGLERGSIPYNEYKKEYHRRFVMIVNGKYVKVNKRPRPEICEICNKKVSRLNYHHWDDSKPHLGMWLCGKCHWFSGMIENGFDSIYLKLKQSIENAK